MRASPALRVSLKRFGVWRGAVALLTLLAGAVLVAWVWAMNPAQQHHRWSWLLATLLGALVLGIAVSLWRTRPFDLHWDGERWHLAEGTDAQPGELAVALDLGPWLLLRFRTHPRGPTRWLPVQRRGLEAQWHALRCAVHATAGEGP